MTYYIEAVSRELLPAGRDWMFIEESNGDQHLVIADDSQIVLPEDALCEIIERVTAGQNLPLQVAS